MDRNHRPTDIHQKVVEFIDSGRSFAVALVLDAAEGSTPQKAGVKAIIDGTGKIWGTIGAVTVPEITASITAQLIAVRRKSNPHLPPSEKELQ